MPQGHHQPKGRPPEYPNQGGLSGIKMPDGPLTCPFPGQSRPVKNNLYPEDLGRDDAQGAAEDCLFQARHGL